jgi:hypothetical protein
LRCTFFATRLLVKCHHSYYFAWTIGTTCTNTRTDGSHHSRADARTNSRPYSYTDTSARRLSNASTYKCIHPCSDSVSDTFADTCSDTVLDTCSDTVTIAKALASSNVGSDACSNTTSYRHLL